MLNYRRLDKLFSPQNYLERAKPLLAAEIRFISTIQASAAVWCGVANQGGGPRAALRFQSAGAAEILRSRHYGHGWRRPSKPR
jgi:hypothetical protein